MSLIAGIPHRQYCTKCNWKSEVIQFSDCLCSPYYKVCPECGHEVDLKPVSSGEVEMYKMKLLFQEIITRVFK